jgi:ribosomal protein S18 acetylase RimI-like enzyme
MMTIARAELPDLADVLRLLNDAAAWLHERGIDQWPHEFTAERAAMIDAFMVRDDDGQAVGTMSITADADPDFWTPAEAAESALYISGLAIDRAYAGLGALMLRWATDYASRLGWRWLRLDARRDNAALHRYYIERGWRYLRTVDVPGRFSGALFDLPARPDPDARAAFARPRYRGWLDPGDRVTVTGRGPGTVSSLYPPDPESGEAGLETCDDGWAAMPGYRVRLDNGPEVLVPRAAVSACS